MLVPASMALGKLALLVQLNIGNKVLMKLMAGKYLVDVGSINLLSEAIP